MDIKVTSRKQIRSKHHFFCLKTLFGALGILVTGSAFAGPSYPTSWQLENQSRQTVLLTCQGKAQGLVSPIIFPLRELGPATRDTYSWANWHNDGLGLNAAEWQCTLKNKNSEAETLSRFQTTIGQDSLLVIRNVGEQLELIRLDTSKETTAQGLRGEGPKKR